MEYDYKGYKLQLSLITLSDYKSFKLKGKCEKVGFEYITPLDDCSFDRLEDRFKEQVDCSINEVKVPIEKFVEVESVSVGEETLVGYLKRISRHSTYPKETDDALIQVANLFAGVLPYNLSDIKKRYFALLESKEENN